MIKYTILIIINIYSINGSRYIKTYILHRSAAGARRSPSNRVSVFRYEVWNGFEISVPCPVPSPTSILALSSPTRVRVVVFNRQKTSVIVFAVQPARVVCHYHTTIISKALAQSSYFFCFFNHCLSVRSFISACAVLREYLLLGQHTTSLYVIHSHTFIIIFVYIHVKISILLLLYLSKTICCCTGSCLLLSKKGRSNRSCCTTAAVINRAHLPLAALVARVFVRFLSAVFVPRAHLYVTSPLQNG